MEEGTLIFIGATTENPYFELNNALLSWARVYVLKPLQVEDLERVIDRALADPVRGPGEQGLTLDRSSGDSWPRRRMGMPGAPSSGEVFYDQISALHKSVRGSAPDAALYWLARMIDGGCDPRYIARRVVRMASEDIGNVDPRALELALNAWEVQERLGSPEGELALARAVVYLACAAKSNAVYQACNAALEGARRSGSLWRSRYICGMPPPGSLCSGRELFSGGPAPAQVLCARGPRIGDPYPRETRTPVGAGSDCGRTGTGTRGS